jgi:hypothetical protein
MLRRGHGAGAVSFLCFLFFLLLFSLFVFDCLAVCKLGKKRKAVSRRYDDHDDVGWLTAAASLTMSNNNGFPRYHHCSRLETEARASSILIYSVGSNLPQGHHSTVVVAKAVLPLYIGLCFTPVVPSKDSAIHTLVQKPHLCRNRSF